MSATTSRAVAAALLAGGVYLTLMIALQWGASALLAGSDLPIRGAVALLLLLGMAAAVAGGAVGSAHARSRDVPPGTSRLVAAAGPAAFAILGMALIVVSGVELSPLREAGTVLGAALGGWAGGVAAERVLDR